MDDLSRNTCAVLNQAGERIARGRYELSEDQTSARFTPASIVTAEQMSAGAFLWPDGEDRIPISDLRPQPDDEHHYRMTVKRQP